MTSSMEATRAIFMNAYGENISEAVICIQENISNPQAFSIILLLMANNITVFQIQIGHKYVPVITACGRLESILLNSDQYE